MTDRTPGFWFREGFRLVRFFGYDNSRAERVWTPGGHSVTWAWAVRDEHLEDFHDIYRDKLRQIVRPLLHADAWAVEWRALDAYICGWRDDVPLAVPFDPALHCVQMRMRPMMCPCGCGRYEGFDYPYFDTHFAVCFRGPCARRRTKPARDF